jgi:hypothetical protein
MVACSKRAFCSCLDSSSAFSIAHVVMNSSCNTDKLSRYPAMHACLQREAERHSQRGVREGEVAGETSRTAMTMFIMTTATISTYVTKKSPAKLPCTHEPRL